MKDNEQPRESQPQNGYGRVPDSLLPKLRELSHLEAHVFLILTIIANRKREPVGAVCMSLAALARECGTERKSLYRAIDGLERAGLVQRESSGHSTCVMVTHYLCHEDAPPVSPCHTSSPQPTEQTLFPDPRNDLRNDRNGGNGEKKPRRLPKPKVIWDEEEQEVRAVDKKWGEDFEARWIDKLGEPRFALQIRKLNAWLANPEKAHRRGPSSRLDQTMERWMLREME